MKKIRLLAILNTLTFGIHLAMTWLVQTKAFSDNDVAEVSNKYPALFTPAGITFAIWGLIYLLLAMFCIYHLVMSWSRTATHPANSDTAAIGGLFIFNSLATAAWLYYFSHEYLAGSVVLIIIQWITLLMIHSRLHIYDRNAGAMSKIFTQLPLSIYFGWITVATLANIAVFLSSAGWEGLGFSPVKGTIIMIGVAVFVALCMIFIKRNVFVGLVVIWALCGMLIRHSANGADPYPDLTLAIEIGLIITGLACLIQLAKNITFKRPFHDAQIGLFPEAPRPVK